MTADGKRDPLNETALRERVLGGAGWRRLDVVPETGSTRRAQIAMSVGVDAGTVPTERWGWLPLAAGVAIVEAVHGCTGVEVVLKWPNDVMAHGRKLAGILAEVAAPQRVIVVGWASTSRFAMTRSPLPR